MKISNTSERLKLLMAERNLKQVDILNLVAPFCAQYDIKMNRSDISQYISGIVEPSQKKLSALSMALGVSEPWLMGYDLPQRGIDSNHASPFGKPIDGLIPRAQLGVRRVPILGDTAAGEPVIANRVYDEWVEIPDDGHHYDAALRVTGDSMTPKYHKGDLVFVRYQEDVLDGQIAVICLEDGVTLKRVYHIPNGLQLLSDNHDYPPIVFTSSDGYAHLVGLAVGVLHWDY